MKVAGLAKSTYEYYKSKKHLNAIQRKENKDKKILDIIKPTFDKHKSRYGYRRIILSLKDELMGINHKRIQRIMRENGLYGKQVKNKYHSYKGDNGESKENLLLHKEVDEVNHKTTYVRDFNTTGPNQKWTTDVSEFKISEGKLYLSPIMDMHDRSIISFDISVIPNFEQTKRMINRAFEQFDDLEGLIFHSDQGWQYQMKQYQALLKEKGIRQSMSRKGNCLDNSLAENFFGLLKSELFYMKEYKTIEELEKDIIEYIDYYNNKRIKGKLKGMSPVQYRVHSQVA